MTAFAWLVVAACAAVPLYAFVCYPVLLIAAGALFGRHRPAHSPEHWPPISIMLPAYNEEAAIAGTLDRILASDYPRDLMQVIVGSDASTDRTDEIVRSYAGRGVELFRMPQRSGKTATENAVRSLLRHDIIVHIDAAVRLHPGALKALVAALGDPTVGVASSRDVSVASVAADANAGERWYVGYEMMLRRFETRVYGIAGASGSLFANRKVVQTQLVPTALSRDFAAPLIAHRQGLRTVSVDCALCSIPRGASLHEEYRRKVRTMARGLETLWYHRDLLNPLRHPAFAWILWSHKLIRWLVPLAVPVGLAALAVASRESPAARGLLALAALAAAAALAGWLLPEDRIPRPLAVHVYATASVLAGLQAWGKALRGERNPLWQPTRRAPVPG